MQRFKNQSSGQHFLSTNDAVYNAFAVQPHLISRCNLSRLRAEANAAWAKATA
ncbi:hypothetical protein [Caulobacter henricii]|uniref:hypothetical protein n=1 Tax=Caulobacter henricii TaxID=69395 RepID=UPI000AAFFCB5|nr:hypothetical protein [Caulobacter henricii]